VSGARGRQIEDVRRQLIAASLCDPPPETAQAPGSDARPARGALLADA
jgi:hypothetical protein